MYREAIIEACERVYIPRGVEQMTDVTGLPGAFCLVRVLLPYCAVVTTSSGGQNGQG